MKLNEVYYGINSKGQIFHKPWQNTRYDNLRLQYGNCFKNKNEASEAKVRVIRAFEEVKGTTWTATFSTATTEEQVLDQMRKQNNRYVLLIAILWTVEFTLIALLYSFIQFRKEMLQRTDHLPEIITWLREKNP